MVKSLQLVSAGMALGALGTLAAGLVIGSRMRRAAELVADEPIADMVARIAEAVGPLTGRYAVAWDCDGTPTAWAPYGATPLV